MIVLAFIIPLALYLVILGSLNWRPRPLMVPGVWDFALLLFGLSGFALLVGPAVISLVHERWLYTWMADPELLAPPDAQGMLSGWNLLYLLYFVLIVSGALYGLFLRRRQTAIYNVDANAFAEVLTEALARLALPYTQDEREIILTQTPPARFQVAEAPALRHVTLTWQPADSPHRTQLEKELRRILERTPAPDNPVGWLLLLIAAAMLLLAIIGLIVWTIMLWTGRA